MKILTILGARPQFIKAGSLSRAIKKHSSVNEIIVHTGQHYDANMSDIFFKQMSIPKPKYFLGVKAKSHALMTGLMMQKIEEVMLFEKPDWVVVFGDTNSTLAGALVASKLQVKIAHIEAGLRSFKMDMPEEINRIVTDRLSTLLFCPTETALNNLKNEGYERMECNIILSGDIMKDSASFYSTIAKKPDIDIDEKNILCTIHRAENTDDEVKLRGIIDALNVLSDSKEVIFPIHPRTLTKCREYKIDLSRLKTIEPVGYLEMIWLLKNCELILTDSGGLQKESYFFSKPCIVLREETEWIELTRNNFSVIAGTNSLNIIQKANTFKFNRLYDFGLFGDGVIADIIIKNLINY